MSSPRRLRLLGAGLALLASLGFAGQEHRELERVVPVPAGQPIPISDFFRPVLFEGPSLNHAGTRLAAIVSNTLNAFDLVLVNLEDNSVDRLSADVTQDVYSYSWLTDDRILFGTSLRREYANEFRVVQVDHPNSSYPIVRYSAVSLIGVPREDPLHPAIWIRGDAFSGQEVGAVQLNALERLAEGAPRGNTYYGNVNRDDPTMMKIDSSYPRPEGGVVGRYLADENGNLAFATLSRNGFETLLRLAGDHWEKCPVDLEHVEAILGPGDRPGEIIVVAPGAKGRPEPVRRLDAETGEPGEILVQDQHYDCRDAEPYYSPATRKLVGIRVDRRTWQTEWLDPDYQRRQQVFSAGFPGEGVSIVCSDDAERKFVLFVHSDVDPGSFFLADLDRHTLGLLKHVSPWFDPARMRLRRAITYVARDGAQIEAYVTLPAGASRKHPVPLIVNPHGGPWARDTGDFNREAQFLASRGYAVLQPNYRGSTDFDWRFRHGERYDFIKMRDDVTDGTLALIRSGLIDRNRIAIMGTSFGAYLSVCGAAFEPDLYRCAVALSGVYDWEQVMAEARQERFFDNPRFEYFRRHLGDPKADPAKFDSISPLRHIDRVKIPIFVYHGYDDPIASIGESTALVSALAAHHVPYEKHFVERETHGIHNLDTAVAIYSDIEAFLAKNMARAPAQ